MNDIVDKLSRYMQVKTVKAGEYVTKDLAGFDGVIVVHTGMCLVENKPRRESGKSDISVGVLRLAGSVIGLEFLFIPYGDRYGASVRAVTLTTVKTLSRAKLLNLISSELAAVKGVLYEEIAAQLAGHYNQVQLRLERQAKAPPEERVLEVFNYVRDIVGVANPLGTFIAMPSYVLYRLSGASERSFYEGVSRLRQAGMLINAGRSSWILPKAN